MRKFRGSAPAPGLKLADAERLDVGNLVTEVRCQQAIDLARRTLAQQSELHAEDRNEQLEDLCLDILNILRPAPSVPVVPGRP